MLGAKGTAIGAIVGETTATGAIVGFIEALGAKGTAIGAIVGETTAIGAIVGETIAVGATVGATTLEMIGSIISRKRYPHSTLKVNINKKNRCHYFIT